MERGQDIRIIQKLQGHSDVKIIMIYTYVLNRAPPWGLQPCRFALRVVLPEHLVIGSV